MALCQRALEVYRPNSPVQAARSVRSSDRLGRPGPVRCGWKALLCATMGAGPPPSGLPLEIRFRCLNPPKSTLRLLWKSGGSDVTPPALRGGEGSL